SLPGVYIFEDDKGKPLYIGKSINLRSRIKQHLEGYRTAFTKAVHYVPLTKTLYFKTVFNDLEAIILESNYIKSYQPRYNDIVKDNKSNLYIIFTDPPNIKILKTRSSDIRTLELDNYEKQVFGPYTSSNTATVLLKQIRRIFGYCLSPFNPTQRMCFNRHLGHCPGACDGTISRSEYNSHLGKIKKFLSGRFKTLKKQLTANIIKASKKLDFETALDNKNELLGLENTLTTQTTSLLLSLSDANDQLLKEIPKKLNHPLLTDPPIRIECFDLAHLMGESYVGSMAVFENCSPSKSEYRHFKVRQPDKSDPYAMRQIISRRLNHPEWGRPDLIVLDGGIPQLSVVSSVVPIGIPVITLAKQKEIIYFYDDLGAVTSRHLDLDDPVLNLFRFIRDEAHRFANTYHSRHKAKHLVSQD
ncbi:MAG: Excinuclease ABC C subunit domain protein, partial [Candidatus Collierbacteria bacterium GW2011_GWE1_46_18]